MVLMLNSSEDDVQIKACEAIYRFATKCNYYESLAHDELMPISVPGDENKELLLQLNACDQLMRLLHSDEKVIRRNAMMVLAVMCQHVEVRNVLKTDESVIPLLLGLLSTSGE